MGGSQRAESAEQPDRTDAPGRPTPSGDEPPAELTDPDVRAALDRVADLTGVPLAEHHTRLEAAHTALQEVLARSRAEG